MTFLVIVSVLINFLGSITNPFMCSGDPIKDAFYSFLKEKCWKNMFLPIVGYEKYGCSNMPSLAEPSVNLTKTSLLNLFLLVSLLLVGFIYIFNIKYFYEDIYKDINNKRSTYKHFRKN